MTSHLPTAEKPFEDDPILGKFVAHAPVNRTALLIRAAVAYSLITLILQIAFADFDDTIAAIILITVYSFMAFGLGWYLLHLWNREVVLYERGFTYREGSRIAMIQYSEVIAVRQRAERIAFFGFIPRDIYEYTLLTKEDELIKLTNLYRRIDKIGVWLDRAIQKARRPILDHRLASGETLIFHELLQMNAQGLHSADKELVWEAIGEYRIEKGMLSIYDTKDNVWFNARLDEIDNLTLLIALLRDHLPDVPKPA